MSIHLDITGEVPWVAKMREKYEILALKNEVCILNFCGYDCLAIEVPVYYGFQLFNKNREKKKLSNDDEYSSPNIVINSMVSSASTKGKLPRGTLLTVLNGVGKAFGLIKSSKKKKKEKKKKKFDILKIILYLIMQINHFLKHY